MKYDKIIRAGINGSGNIVIEQILNYLFAQKNQPIDITKSQFHRTAGKDDIVIHTFRYLDNLEPSNDHHSEGLENLNLGIIIPHRDFRSVLASQIRKRKLLPTIANIKRIYHTLFREMYVERHKYTTQFPNQQDILILEYSRYFENIDYAISQLEIFLEIQVTDKQKNFIKNEFSLEKNKKKSSTMQSWSQVDTLSGIHGQHIGNGQPNSWKTFFPEKLHEFVTRLMSEELREYPA